MATNYDGENRPWLRSLYSTAAKRQACVPCPSACSCDLGSRSVMDQLMARAWSQGTEGNTSVFNFHKENYTGEPADPPGPGSNVCNSICDDSGGCTCHHLSFLNCNYCCAAPGYYFTDEQCQKCLHRYPKCKTINWIPAKPI